ncbi:MAG: dehypoxanthine futalosine cyclase [Bacteroidales bacterium]|nr:dehypoxanthine futalosine cyclase [Bacteroidales bacterium]
MTDLYKKAIRRENITIDEGLFLYEKGDLIDLAFIAHEIRKKTKNPKIVTWQIDRNINITNVCVSGCKFCNFHRKIKDKDAYITSIEEYKQKINELFKLGGNQVLLQGGCHPKLGLEFYKNLFNQLKQEFPNLRIHALGPPEVFHISRLEKKPVEYILEQLVESGLDSLPGAGAEILSDRVRGMISPGKCTGIQWLDVMREAHRMNLLTSATMMFGHVETNKERIEHLLKIRDLQNERPANSPGFKAFIPWPFQDENTELKNQAGIKNTTTPTDYIRLIAVSRILLNNIENIQASWLTVGKETAQVCLHAGANDLGSIMIEEKVVSSAGANHHFNATGIQKAITEAGFIPKLRNQAYELVRSEE